MLPSSCCICTAILWILLLQATDIDEAAMRLKYLLSPAALGLVSAGRVFFQPGPAASLAGRRLPPPVAPPARPANPADQGGTQTTGKKIGRGLRRPLAPRSGGNR